MVFLGLALFLSLSFAGEGSEVRTGSLMGIEGHDAEGNVSVGKDPRGRTWLTMTNINVDRVPDGRVYLANGLNFVDGVELGKLSTFSGTVTFTVPLTVDLAKYDSVVIWCKKFDVGIGHATLR